jgi:hypothetical protein
MNDPATERPDKPKPIRFVLPKDISAAEAIKALLEKYAKPPSRPDPENKKESEPRS